MHHDQENGFSVWSNSYKWLSCLFVCVCLFLALKLKLEREERLERVVNDDSSGY